MRLLVWLLLVWPAAAWSAGNESIHAMPINPSNQPNAAYFSETRTFLNQEDAARCQEQGMGGFIVSGGLHAAAAGTTSAAFATVGYTSSCNRVNQASAAINYTTQGCAASDTAWVIISASIENTLNNFNRVSGTDYFVDCTNSTQPALPSDSAWLMSVAISGGNLGTPTDLSTRGPLGVVSLDRYASFAAAVDDWNDSGDPSITLVITRHAAVAGSLTVTPNITLQFVGAGQLDIATGVTVTHNGSFLAACESGRPRFVLNGTGIFLFNRAMSVCPQWWGAYSDDTNGATTVAAINNAEESLQTNGGEVFFPTGIYRITGVDAAGRAIWVRRNNMTLRGTGRSSQLKATNNTDTMVCVSPNSDCSANSGSDVTGVTIRDLFFQGTGTGAYSALLAGRCILGARVANIAIHDNWVEGCSMIGIAVNSGNGQYTTISRNHIHDVFYTGINFNGPVTQSLISDNVISNVDSVGVATPQCIQVDGHSIVQGNSCFDIAGYGILHGEGNYDGTVNINNNLIVRTTAEGVHANYHGPVQILGNTIINALTGIILSGDTSIFNIPVNDSLIANNTIINSPPFGIYTTSPRTAILGNKILRLTTLTNTGGTSLTEIIAASAYTFGIRLQAAGLYTADNVINGAAYGIGVWNGTTDATYGYNQMQNIATAQVGAIASTGTVNATGNLATHLGGRIYEGASSSPTSGPVRSVNWQMNNTAPASGNPMGWLNTSHITTNTTAASAASTNLQVASTAGMTTSHIITVVNSQGDYTAQYRTIAVVVDGTNLTLGSAITCGSGEIVYADRYHPLPNVP